MVDSIQKATSIPLPIHQTVQGQQDPLPLDSAKELSKVAHKVSEADSESLEGGLKDYLNQAGILTLEKRQVQDRFDPVNEIASGSVYTQPDDKTQF